MTILVLGLVAFIAGGVLIWRFRSPIVYALTMAAVLAASVYASGTPRPRALGVPETIIVVGMQIIPEEAIYLWALGDPPVAYALPWNTEQAEELQEMERDAEASGEMGFGIELSYSGEGAQNEAPPIEAPRK